MLSLDWLHSSCVVDASCELNPPPPPRTSLIRGSAGAGAAVAVEAAVAAAAVAAAGRPLHKSCGAHRAAATGSQPAAVRVAARAGKNTEVENNKSTLVPMAAATMTRSHCHDVGDSYYSFLELVQKEIRHGKLRLELEK